MMHYSKSRRGFFNSAIHDGQMPEDAQPISDEAYRALLDGQGAGLEIVPDDTGQPVLVDPETLSSDLETLRNDALKETLFISGQLSEALVSHTPPGLRDSWTAKAAAAHAVIAGTATQLQTDIIAAEAAITGESVADLADSIVANESDYLIFAGKVSGAHRHARNLILAASDAAGIEDALTEMRTARDDLLAELEI